MQPTASLLETLLKIESPSGCESALAEFIVGWFAEREIPAHVDEAGNAIASLGRDDTEPALILLGHMDTVTPQLAVRLEGGRLYGRGAVDAKGPLAAFMLALAELSHRSPGDTRVLFAGAVEEEAPSSRGARHLAARWKPRYCIVGEPSGWQGITLGYKGRLLAEYRVQEPLRHSATPDPNACEKAVQYWNRVQAFCQEQSRDRTPFYALDARLQEFRSWTEAQFDRASLRLGFRLPPGWTPLALIQALGALASEGELTFDGSEPPILMDRTNPVARVLVRAIRQTAGEPRFKLKTGTSDMNVVYPIWNCPVVAYGPGDSRLDHTAEEHILLDDVERATQVLVKAIRELLGAASEGAKTAP